MQSGSTRVLEAMNRGYEYEDYLDRIERLRAAVPGIALTTDIVAGFPGESEQDHEMTLNALKDIRFDGIFAFRYSERPGTRAADMEGQVPVDVRLRRLKEVLDLQDGITSEINQALTGSKMEILVEGTSESDDSRLSGRTRTNKIVNFAYNSASNDLKGRLIGVRIIRAGKHSLEGEPCG
jgi:tRNA-2-methylthio-N6-dimethylallyladenosine synthase